LKSLHQRQTPRRRTMCHEQRQRLASKLADFSFWK
jgi:hypothetical protein